VRTNAWVVSLCILALLAAGALSCTATLPECDSGYTGCSYTGYYYVPEDCWPNNCYCYNQSGHANCEFSWKGPGFGGCLSRQYWKTYTCNEGDCETFWRMVWMCIY
jgi:hypothetical protein